MRPSKTLLSLSVLIALLSLAATLSSLLWTDGGGDGVPFVTARNQTVMLYGRGLYRHDSLFIAAGFRGQDWVTVCAGVPLLLLASLRHWRRPSARTVLLLVGVLAFFLYVYASMALGAAYNQLFLVYVALFSLSFFAFTTALISVDSRTRIQFESGRLPRRGPALFMLASGLVTLVVWLSPVLGALAQGKPPALLDHYTTMVTYALDLAIITPTALLSGLLILRRASLGYLLAFPLLGVIVMLAPTIVASTLSQRAAGISFTVAEMVGPIAGFVMLGSMGAWIAVAILKRLPEPGETGT